MQKWKTLRKTTCRSFVSIVVLVIPVVLFGQEAFYTPKYVHMPLHHQKQQLYISLGTGGGFDINLSCAPFHHFAFFAIGNIARGTHKRSDLWGNRYNIHKKDQALISGAGYFSKVKTCIIEAYAGFGTYRINNYWYFPGESYLNGGFAEFTQARYRNVFFQFNAGRKIKRLEFGGTARLSYSRYSDLQFFGNYDNYQSSFENLKSINLDPGWKFGTEWKKIIFAVQFGVSIPLNKPAATRIETYTFNNTIKSIQDTEVTRWMFAFLGRVSIQHNFDFSRKTYNPAH